MTAAFWLALLKALPLVIELLSAIADRARTARERGQGYDEAVADGVKASLDGLRQATEAANEAEARHRANPDSDDGFDKRFQRND